MAFNVADNATLKAENPPPPGTSPLRNGYWSEPWPVKSEAIMSRLRRRVTSFGQAHGQLPKDIRHSLLAGMERSKQMASRLRALYPEAQLAIYAFDAQIPAEMSLACHLAGIRTIAVQERPTTAVTSSVPVAVDTLLTASPYFSKSTRASDSVAVRHCQEVGMWRSDFLSQMRHDPDRASGIPGHRQLVVALPYHVIHAPKASDHPLATSVSTMRSFASDLLRLARALPDVDFVLRGKSVGWMNMHEMQDIVGQIESCANLSVSTNYGTFNESYRLCSQASLVIAKHTSLVEECFSVGIPCLLHDYSWNYSDYERLTLPFIPRTLWVESYQELMFKTRLLLSRKESDERIAVSDIRNEIFGNWSDGRVRRRTRGLFETLVRS